MASTQSEEHARAQTRLPSSAERSGGGEGRKGEKRRQPIAHTHRDTHTHRLAQNLMSGECGDGGRKLELERRRNCGEQDVRHCRSSAQFVLVESREVRSGMGGVLRWG